MSFEEDYKRLAEIVNILEAGDKSLDESVKLFEEATECRRRLLDSLSEQKGKLMQIKQQADSYSEEEMK